ncbi:hypothetical protein [Halomonas sp. BM-2019]|uniref:hypothetical protein n=1 Tax=Halomonas sp. BM-2019 TaxID=2811227 RepID=UPI001B3C2A57|nr:MAG: hypothetical protein J5F18_07055 [Halomonas sp. BM-2019]
MTSLLESDVAKPRAARKIMPAISAYGSKNDQKPNLEKPIAPPGEGGMVYFLL